MRAVVISSCWRSCSRAAAVAVLAAGFAGCSADTTRFDSPNANPFASHSAAPAAEVTGSVQTPPSSQISSQSLPPPNASPPTTAAAAGVPGGGPGCAPSAPVPGPAPSAAPGMGSYNPAPARMAPPLPPSHEVTGSAAPQPHAPKPYAVAAAPTSGGNVHLIG